MRKIALASPLLSALTLVVLAEPAFAQVTQATAAVEGLACPFCAFGVEKKLKQVRGVGGVEVQMEDGTAELSAVEGGSIEVGQIPPAIRKAGFTPGRLAITAAGTLVVDGERTVFHDAVGDQRMLLVNVPRQLEARVRHALETGGSIRLTGTVHFHADELPRLTPESLEVSP